MALSSECYCWVERWSNVETRRLTLTIPEHASYGATEVRGYAESPLLGMTATLSAMDQRVKLPPGNWFAPPGIEAAAEATKLSELSFRVPYCIATPNNGSPEGRLDQMLPR
jgi:hypothetical protein